MTQKLSAQIQSLETKITELKEQQRKLKEQLEGNALEVLKRHNAFDHDLETLLGGLLFVCESLQTHSPELMNQWKAKGGGKGKKFGNKPSASAS
jgi:chromosome segregation ATPase